jgi:hypothetical protein
VVDERLHVWKGVAAVGAVADNGVLFSEVIFLENCKSFLALESRSERGLWAVEGKDTQYLGARWRETHEMRASLVVGWEKEQKARRL